MKKKCKKGISVIIPTFNRVKFLYSTLICLINQKIDVDCGYEVVIIDSGDDETELMVKMFQNSGQVSIIYKKIKKCKNRSLLRNVGAELANYTILCFLDNDMLTPPDFIQSHFNLHSESPHLVIMGARKFLTEFNIYEFGEEKLATNFTSLDSLPWYMDERTNENTKLQPWRFVYSHTLSMESIDFDKAGKFNNDFGDHWGFEDIELGIRLQKNNCNFVYLSEFFTYHQPHFNQSQADQKSAGSNEYLFMKTHNYYEVELFKCFSPSFAEYYFALHNLGKENQYPKENVLKKFDVILGALMSVDNGSIEKKVHGKMHLGTYCIEDNDSQKNVYIMKQFFDFPKLIKISILFEAFRISSKVYFEDLKENQENEILSLALDSGIVAKIEKEGDYSLFIREWNQDSKLYLMLLPDVLQPEKRYVYLWLSNMLLKSGHFVKIRDMKNTRVFDKEDFYLDSEIRTVISENMDKFFGKNRLQFIGSSSMLMSDFEIDFPRTKSSYIFFDDDYHLIYDSIKKRQIGMCTCCDEKVFSLVTLLSVYDVVKGIDIQNKQKSNAYCCFMENGFREDGIDLILQAFAVKKNDFKLTIKIPDYRAIKEEVFPLHNEYSKEVKAFAASQKFENEFRLLKEKILEYGLSSKVQLVVENLSIFEIAKLINSNDYYINASRTICGSPELYMALLLKKNVIIPSHLNILEELKLYCIQVPSNTFQFAQELNVPTSCINSNYYACRIEVKDLCDSLSKESLLINETLEKDLIHNANKFLDGLFN